MNLWGRNLAWNAVAKEWMRAGLAKKYCILNWHKNEKAHLHPRSQGLQIYSSHHRCQGSSWSQKVRCVRSMWLRHGESSYRTARGGRLWAPEGREPAVSHDIRHMPSPGGLLLPAQRIFTKSWTYSCKRCIRAFFGEFTIGQLDCFAFLKAHDTNSCSSICSHLSDSEWPFHSVSVKTKRAGAQISRLLSPLIFSKSLDPTNARI